MSKRVLNVGQCRPDQHAIRALLRSHFDVEVVSADLLDDALESLNRDRYDLVLINRKLDRDGSDGLEVLRAVRRSERHGDVPVMLVSNYPEAQAAAIAAGALPGFGKSELDAPQTVEKLRQVLEPD